MRQRLKLGKSQKGQSAPLDDDATRLEERKKMVVGLTNTAIDSLRKKSIHLMMTDKQKSSQTLTEVAFWTQKFVISLIQKGPNFRLPRISLKEEEGSISVVKSAVSVYKTIKSGIYDHVNSLSESSRMDPRSEPVKEWELGIGANPGAWQPGIM